jgi:hypothetical protein
MNSAEEDIIRAWLLSCADEATSAAKFIVIAYSLPRETKTSIDLLCASRRSFAEIHNIFSEEYEGHRLSLGSALLPQQAARFSKMHRGIRVRSFKHPSFDSTNPDHRYLVRDILGSLFPSQWYARGFLLIDIVQFSLRSPAEQVALRTSLEESIRQASLALKHLCTSHDLSFNLIPTGDGFYAWHSRPGRDRDAATLALGIVALGFLSRERLESLGLRVRTAFAVERVYTLPQTPLDAPFDVSHRFQDAIGPALNIAARLCSAAAPGQVLIADLPNLPEKDPAEPIRSTKDLVAAANKLIHDPAKFTVRLDPDNALKVTDKHGELHRCYNANATSFWYTGTVFKTVEIGMTRDATPELKASDFTGR